MVLATLLVAGTPVAVVWGLRFTGTVDSVVLTLLIGVALSLLTSWAGRVVWETRQGSEDLLFNELMIWGYLHRRSSQRRLADAAELAAPLQASAAGDARAVRGQTRLLERLVAGMETRDPYLHGHSRRVARHSWMIARHMKLDAREAARIRTAAALHDVGKTKTPKTILHKAGPLTDEEYRIIKLHPGEGAEMAAVLGDPELEAMIRHHHERLDGSGYPDGLHGEAVPLGARIIAVADTFDAITSARPYRAAAPHRKAIDILHAEAGTKLDADVVRAFCNHYAGRGPVALWSFVSSLPERLLSWLSASAGGVASAAKVAAVAALVGASAATSATLGVASEVRPGHTREAGAAAAIVSATPAGAIAALAGRGSSSSSGDHASGGAGRARRGTARSRRPVPTGSPPAGAYVPAADTGQGAPTPAAGGDAPAARHEEGSGGGSHQETPRSGAPRESGGAEKPTVQHEEGPAAGRVEEPATKGKSEEASGKGKSEEPHAKPEESGTHEEASGGNSGSGSSGSSGNSGKGSAGKGSVKSEAGGPSNGE